MKDDILLTITELAEELGVTRITIQNWKKKGMPVCYIKRSNSVRMGVRYRPDDVKEWLLQQQKKRG